MISLVIPVYNRPDEIVELLESISQQGDTDFEVIVVEDGSTRTCKEEIAPFADKFKLQYFFKENSGPGPSRNYGVQHASGDYVICARFRLYLAGRLHACRSTAFG